MARRLRGFSMDELVRRMDNKVSKMSISKYERGIIKPSEGTLQSIADACQLPLSFFYRPTVSISTLTYRFEQDLPTKTAERIRYTLIQQIEQYLTAANLLDAQVPYSNPLPHTTLRTYEDSEEAALALREAWQLGTQPIVSAYELIERHGIIVIDIESDVRNLLGFSCMANDTIPVIVINTTANPTVERRRFTLLHELAHLLFNINPDEGAHPVIGHTYLTSDTYTLKAPTVERLCHRFAGAMLVPRDIIYYRTGIYRTSLTPTELVSIKNLYGMSLSAIVHRMHDLAVISDTLYNNIYTKYLTADRKLFPGEGYQVEERANRFHLLQDRIIAETTNSDDPDGIVWE